MDHTESELESFRQKWREEVAARSGKHRAVSGSRSTTRLKPVQEAQTQRAQQTTLSEHAERPEKDVEEIDGYEPPAYHDVNDPEEPKKLGYRGTEARKYESREPQSALEHYEKAVERETQGSLGDSVNLYRKAFKLDANVHEIYKTKHFPPAAAAFPKAKPANPNPSNASVTVPNTAHHSLHGLSSSIADLTAEFSNLSIPAALPDTDLSPPPPCPIARIPEEILSEIFLYTAVADVAGYSRLSQVCKRFAYLVMTEERIWKRVALGSGVGFAAMHYRYACNLLGGRLESSMDDTKSLDFEATAIVGDVSSTEPWPNLSESFLVRTTTLLDTVYASSYRQMFRSRPRIRFAGCYISTVNYSRPGASSNSFSSLTNFSSPVHIVTYYRYLRFFRDGTCISLLTTTEPIDVVHHLTKDNLHHNHSGGLPSAVMRDALRGRWRLSGGSSSTDSEGTEESDVEEAEGDVHVETEGVTPKYMWKMRFSLGSAGRDTRNNKLSWKGFWSYNRLTDDWGEFGLKNDKAFYWSRVKSYGAAE